MATVCVVQNAECENLGILGELLQARGITIRYVRPYEGERVPRRAYKYDAVIVLGGPMGVYDKKHYPYLTQEMHFISHAVGENIPVLGICLGSQLLAAALGAAVTKAVTYKEIGWIPVQWAPEAAKDKLLDGQKQEFNSFQWHGDVFELPRGAVSLARSEKTEHQAFRYGDRAYGFMFHLEVTPKIIEEMLRNGKTDLKTEGVKAKDVQAETARNLAALQEMGRAVLQRWVNLIPVDPMDAQPEILTPAKPGRKATK
jgi:GMP synthase (glutamine-hydrolysing)